jgi:carbon-monoxide dehydrogenase large subunit
MQTVERRGEKEGEEEAIETATPFVGQSIKRVEDRRLLTGKDNFLDNIQLPRTAYAGFLRSPHAHARIVKVDTSKVRGNTHLLAILTAEEVSRETEPIPVIWRVPTARLHEHHALAQGIAKHVGDPILAIAVDKRDLVQDLLDMIDVEYEQLEPVLDPASAESKPPIHESLGTNTCFSLPITSGDAEKAIEEADLVVSETFNLPRLSACPIETRGVLADPRGDTLTIYSSTQWPHILRTVLAKCLRVSENRLRVIAPDVGGAFGVKGEVYAEEIIVPLLAMKCSLPVKWIESRTESFLATAHSRAQRIDARASFKKDGMMTGLSAKVLCDFGAYLHTLTPGCAFITAISMSGPYRIANYLVEAKGVYTNKVGISAYRGFGQPEAAFVVERIMGIAARKLGIDEAEIRFKNLIQPSEMPFRNASGGMNDSGDYPALLRKALDLAGYDDMIKRRSEARKLGKMRGIGISMFTEVSGFAPGFVFALFGLTIGGYESATVRIDPHGKVTVMTGASPHGQGFNTTLAQVCADELGVKPDDVQIIHGDTFSAPYGQGTFGSRNAAVAASAAILACRKLKDKVALVGARILKLESPSELFLSPDGFVRSKKKNEAHRISLGDIASAAYRAQDLGEIEPCLESSAVFSPAGLATSYAVHISEVDVDRETGKVTLLKHVTVHDCGKQINPMIVEGQIEGGLLQAIGACLYEEVVYDNKNGNLLSTSLLDFLLPTAEAIPRNLVIGSTSVSTPINPLGAKGTGESATIIAPPAIANAVSDAVGFDHNEIPMTPERIWSAMRLKKS